jgi:hypothetical protein
MRSVTSLLTEHTPFGVAVRPRATRWDSYRRDADVSQDSVEGGGELAGPVADKKPELVDSITEIHHEVADLLGGPPAVRIGRRADDVDVAAADLQDEEHVDPLEGERAVDVEEVAGQHRRCLCVGTAARWCRCAGPLQEVRVLVSGSVGSSRH